MQLSIIVPVYNLEKYILKCLESLVGQTYKSYEVIIVDDGSTDNSGKICDEYAQGDYRIKVVHKEKSVEGRLFWYIVIATIPHLFVITLAPTFLQTKSEFR